VYIITLFNAVTVLFKVNYVNELYSNSKN